MEAFGYHIRITCTIVACFVIGTGCSEPSETATKGHLLVSSAEVAFPYIDQSAQKYWQVYNEAYIDVGRTTAREALVELAEGKSRLAVLSREPNEAEMEALSAGERQFVTRTVAHDALAVILHGDNPVNDLTVGQLKDIFTGKVANWQELGGRNVRIRPLVRDRNSGTYEIFQDRVLDGADFGGSVYPCSTMAVMTGVAGSSSGAIGITGLLMTNRPSSMGNFKVIRIAENEDERFYLPTQDKIHSEKYPLRRPLVLCYFKKSSYEVNLVSGFVTFLTAVKGQQIAIDEGLVPATMPVRTVKIGSN